MKNRKKNTKLILLALLICITLGYAALRTGLNINGTTNVSSASWNVHFENYQMSNATNITPTTEPSISGTTTTSISYEVDLEVPGDLYEFSVEVVNGGSIDALISLISKYNGSEIGPSNPVPNYIEYTVTDGNGDPIVDGHRLNHGNREIVKIFVKYKEDASVLPSQDATLRFDVEIEATQAPKASSVQTGNYVVSDTHMTIGSGIPQGVNVRSTPEEAMADWSVINHTENDPRPFYLQHILNSNSEIVKTYVNFVVTEDTVMSNDGLTGGTYTIRGGVDESELAAEDREVLITNARTIFDAFGSEYCSGFDPYETTDFSSISCSASGLYAYASSTGFVYAGEGDGFTLCIVDNRDYDDNWDLHIVPFYSYCV